MMSADIFMAIGVFSVLTGVSAFAIARAKATQKRSWIDEMESRRRSERFSEPD